MSERFSIKRSVQRLFCRLSKPHGSASLQKMHSRRLFCEALERRQLLAVAVNALPDFQILPADVTEGDSGSINAAFQVSMPASETSVSVRYATQQGTAKAGVDFRATSGTLTFAPGVNRSEEHTSELQSQR